MKTRPASWDDLRFLLALHRDRSFFAAGKSLGVAASTVARRVEAAERSLGRVLVHRSNDGTKLDTDALRLVALAEELEGGLCRPHPRWARRRGLRYGARFAERRFRAAARAFVCAPAGQTPRAARGGHLRGAQRGSRAGRGRYRDSPRALRVSSDHLQVIGAGRHRPVRVTRVRRAAPAEREALARRWHT